MHYFRSKNNPIFFIAEIGGNHEGNFEYAQKLTKLAIKSGVDAVKFQIYSGDNLVSRIESPDRNKHFKKFELTRVQYQKLAEMCHRTNVVFMASVWDEERYDWVKKYINIHKVGSGDITAFPLIKRFVRTKKPIILSTGLCTLEEIKNTLQYIYSLDEDYSKQKKVALLQCTTSYPCLDEEANLNSMFSLKNEFNTPVGYSDHTIGYDAALAASTMGAEIIEMHFTDQREGKEFRDHLVSITCEEIKELLKKISRVRVLQGNYDKQATESEISSGYKKSFRRSVYAAKAIKRGEVLTENNITILRPEHGISAMYYESLLGEKANCDLQKHEVLKDTSVTDWEL